MLVLDHDIPFIVENCKVLCIFQPRVSLDDMTVRALQDIPVFKRQPPYSIWLRPVYLDRTDIPLV